MADTPEESPDGVTDAARDAARARRLQILATEHWSLLASRTTTQNEVLSRIAIFLTLVSASLVSLALIGQATEFSGVFPLIALVLLSFIVLVGVLTQARVINVSFEDLMYVLAMNRIRGAYVEVDPGVVPILMTSAADDGPGMRQTYYWLGPRGSSQVLGSSAVFTVAVNSALIAVLIATASATAGLSFLPAIVIGVAIGLAFLTVSMTVTMRRFYGFWKTYQPLFTSPPDEERNWSARPPGSGRQ